MTQISGNAGEMQRGSGINDDEIARNSYWDRF